MNNTEFKKNVGEVLKQEGFLYKNKQYYFENEDLIVFVAFQKSNFENSFYIIYNDNDKMIGDYKLSDLTKERLSESILENTEKFIKPAFEKGIDDYLEMYPHLKRRLPLTVKEYLDSAYK